MKEDTKYDIIELAIYAIALATLIIVITFAYMRHHMKLYDQLIVLSPNTNIVIFHNDSLIYSGLCGNVNIKMLSEYGDIRIKRIIADNPNVAIRINLENDDWYERNK